MLDKAIDRYTENLKIKSAGTQTGYGYTMKQFYECCGNKLVSGITKQDLIDFVAYPQEEELADRTVVNRVGDVVTFLQHFDVKDVTPASEVHAEKGQELRER